MGSADERRPLDVVFVCRGNRFRSPLAAALFERAAPPGAARVASVGTLAVGAVPPLDAALEHGARLGVDLASHRARVLAPGSLAGAELVLGFELSDVATAVVEGRAPRAHAFTLPELVGLLDTVAAGTTGDADARAARDRAQAARAAAACGAGALPEIRDPLGAPRSEQRAIADRIDDLVRRAAAALFGSWSQALGR